MIGSDHDGNDVPEFLQHAPAYRPLYRVLLIDIDGQEVLFFFSSVGTRTVYLGQPFEEPYLVRDERALHVVGTPSYKAADNETRVRFRNGMVRYFRGRCEPGSVSVANGIQLRHTINYAGAMRALEKALKITVPGGNRPVYAKPQQNIKGDITMNIAEMIAIMQLEGGAKVVRATYLSNGSIGEDTITGYCFKNVLGLDLKEGDLIVCETRDTFSLLRVVDPDVMATDVSCALHDLKHVVAKVRNDDYEAVKLQENEAHRKLALSEVTSKLVTYKKQVDEDTFDAVAGLLGVAEDEADAEVIED